jgi:hypothetical protein
LRTSAAIGTILLTEFELEVVKAFGQVVAIMEAKWDDSGINLVRKIYAVQRVIRGTRRFSVLSDEPQDIEHTERRGLKGCSLFILISKDGKTGEYILDMGRHNVGAGKGSDDVGNKRDVNRAKQSLLACAWNQTKL